MDQSMKSKVVREKRCVQATPSACFPLVEMAKDDEIVLEAPSRLRQVLVQQKKALVIYITFPAWCVARPRVSQQINTYAGAITGAARNFCGRVCCPHSAPPTLTTDFRSAGTPCTSRPNWRTTPSTSLHVRRVGDRARRCSRASTPTFCRTGGWCPRAIRWTSRSLRRAS